MLANPGYPHTSTIPPIVLTRTQVLTSSSASLNPCHIDCSSLLIQSSSPTSSSSLHTANAFSSSSSHEVVRGKLGRMKYAQKARKMVMTPSIRKSQRQARHPRMPSMLPVMPADMRPEKAPAIRAPE